MVPAKILLSSVLLPLMLLTGCMYGGSENSESPNVSVPSPTLTTEATEAKVPAIPIEFDMSTVDRVVIVQTREKQTAWETVDAELVSKFVDTVAGFEYGTPQPGGYAGEFLLVKMYEGDSELGIVHFATSSQIQQVSNDLPYLYPIKAGSWSDTEWEDFLGECTTKP